MPESGVMGVKQFQAGSTDPSLGSGWESGRLEGVSEELLRWSQQARGEGWGRRNLRGQRALPRRRGA